MNWPLVGKENKSQAEGQICRSGGDRQSPGSGGSEVPSGAPGTLATRVLTGAAGAALGGAATAVHTALLPGASSEEARVARGSAAVTRARPASEPGIRASLLSTGLPANTQNFLRCSGKLRPG